MSSSLIDGGRGGICFTHCRADTDRLRPVKEAQQERAESERSILIWLS